MVHRKAKPNFCMLGQEAIISETMMPPSNNRVISAASLTSALKMMSPFLPGAFMVGLYSAIDYSSV
ncbi:hypothetical protein D3C80_1653340 [compost metagenome]